MKANARPVRRRRLLPPLLLWGTQMVTRGVLRGYGVKERALRRWLGRCYLGHRWRSRSGSFGINTALLQSSTGRLA